MARETRYSIPSHFSIIISRFINVQDVYHKHIMDLLGEEIPSAASKFAPAVAEPVAPPTPNPQLTSLKKEVHELEIRYRVAAQRNAM